MLAVTLVSPPREVRGLTALTRNRDLEPSGRLQTWRDAAATWKRHPFLGQGPGTVVADVAYRTPSGTLRGLTDAHSVYLSVAAQTGILGLAALVLLFGGTFVRLAGPSLARDSLAPVSPGPGSSAHVERAWPRALFAALLGAFFYQGLSGSFEETRHIWALLGLGAACAYITYGPPYMRQSRVAKD
jgi:O-antigen ligase